MHLELCRHIEIKEKRKKEMIEATITMFFKASITQVPKQAIQNKFQFFKMITFIYVFLIIKAIYDDARKPRKQHFFSIFSRQFSVHM